MDESIGGAYEVSKEFGTYVLGRAKEAFVDSLGVTSIVLAILVAIAMTVALWLIPKGFKADATH